MTYLSAKTLTALAILALPLAGCVTDSPNRSVESVHQPVVSYAAYTFDVQASGDSLSAYEAGRLNDWFASIGLGYGDQVAIVTDAGYYSPGIREGIADVVFHTLDEGLAALANLSTAAMRPRAASA